MFIRNKSHLDAADKCQTGMLAKIDQKSVVVWVICIILFGAFYWKLRNIGPVVLEDFYMIMYTKSFFAWKHALAVSQGRVINLLVCWFWAAAFFHYSLLKYQIIRMLWTILCVFSVWRLVRDLTNKAIAQFAVLLSVIFFVVQIEQHDLLFSYPGFAHMPFSCMLLGLDTQLRYLKTSKKRWIILTVILVFISGFCQEGFLVDYLMYAWLAFCVYYMKSENRDWKNIICKAFKSLIPIILTGALILVIYIAWKIVYPGDYAGASFSYISKKGILITWFTLMNGMFPLRTAIRHFLTYPDFALLNNIGFLDVFVALISAIGVMLSCAQVRKEKALSSTKNVLILLGCALGCALAPALHALTANYVSQVLNGFTYSYTISFFCYFFIMASISLLFSVALHCEKDVIYRGIVCGCAILIFAASLVNSASNNFALQKIQRKSDAGMACDAFLKDEANREICSNHTLYLEPNDVIQAPRVFYSVLTAASDMGVGENASTVEDGSVAVRPYPDNTVWITYDGEAFHAQPVS